MENEKRFKQAKNKSYNMQLELFEEYCTILKELFKTVDSSNRGEMVGYLERIIEKGFILGQAPKYEKGFFKVDIAKETIYKNRICLKKVAEELRISQSTLSQHMKRISEGKIPKEKGRLILEYFARQGYDPFDIFKEK